MAIPAIRLTALTARCGPSFGFYPLKFCMLPRWKQWFRFPISLSYCNFLRSAFDDGNPERTGHFCFNKITFVSQQMWYTSVCSVHSPIRKNVSIILPAKKFSPSTNIWRNSVGTDLVAMPQCWFMFQSHFHIAIFCRLRWRLSAEIWRRKPEKTGTSLLL